MTLATVETVVAANSVIDGSSRLDCIKKLERLINRTGHIIKTPKTSGRWPNVQFAEIRDHNGNTVKMLGMEWWESEDFAQVTIE